MDTSKQSLKLGLYQHYKGNLYNVLSVARHSENEDPFVVYQALYGDYGVWIRPLAMFTESIELDGKPIARFSFVRDTLNHLPIYR